MQKAEELWACLEHNCFEQWLPIAIGSRELGVVNNAPVGSDSKEHLGCSYPQLVGIISADQAKEDLKSQQSIVRGEREWQRRRYEMP